MSDDQGLPALDIEMGEYDDVEEEANKKLDPGPYRVRIVQEPEARFGQDSGKQYLAWRLQTVDCADPDDNNFTLFYNTPLEGKGRVIFFKFIESLGQRWEGSRISTEFLQGLVGLEFNVEVGIRTWNDQESNEVKRVLPNLP
jgi:hypothetical protein